MCVAAFIPGTKTNPEVTISYVHGYTASERRGAT